MDWSENAYDICVNARESGVWLEWLEGSPLWMVAKLEPAVTDDDEVFMVNFTIYEVQELHDDGSPIFMDKDQTCRLGKEAQSLEQAAIHGTGFFKWDGCSEFEFDETHTCDWAAQEALLGAITACRRVSQRVFNVPRVSEDQCLAAEAPEKTARIRSGE